MAKRKWEDGTETVGADREHPIYSKLGPDGSLSQQGISCDGFQREVGIQRHTELVPGGKLRLGDYSSPQRYNFCWDLHLYQHPGCRKIIPLGCVRSKKTGLGVDNPAPKLARQFSRALHRLAQQGYDPTGPLAGTGGGPRGYWWHRFVAPMLCGEGTPDVKYLRRRLKNEGVMGETSSLDGMRRRRR